MSGYVLPKETRAGAHAGEPRDLSERPSCIKTGIPQAIQTVIQNQDRPTGVMEFFAQFLPEAAQLHGRQDCRPSPSAVGVMSLSLSRESWPRNTHVARAELAAALNNDDFDLSTGR